MFAGHNDVTLIHLTGLSSADFWKVGNLTGTVKKHMPTLEALQVLYRRMKYEYDFYNFVRDQFHLVKKKIGLKSSHPSPAHDLDFLHELTFRTDDPLEEDDQDEEEEDDTTLEDANNWFVQPWTLVMRCSWYGVSIPKSVLGVCA